jgi:hypothetical protein
MNSMGDMGLRSEERLLMAIDAVFPSAFDLSPEF